MSQPHDWCRTVEKDGATILLMRGWNDEHDCPQMTTTFQADHFLPGDTAFGETTLTFMKSDDDTPFSDAAWKKFCDPEAVFSRVDEVISAVLKNHNALH